MDRIARRGEKRHAFLLPVLNKGDRITEGGEQMEIIRLSIDALTPDPQNAKEHPEWQVEQIKKSIENFGNLDPIGIWGDNNLIVEGHGRYMALKELGYTEAECIRLDWLSEEERKAYALAHNKLTMNSEFDAAILADVLKSIGEIDMSLFGFDLTIPKGPEDILEDAIPDVDETETTCEEGQIWQLGDHRLLCGDCTNAANMARLMDGEEASLLITDPPYNVALGMDESLEEKKRRRRRLDNLVVQNDKMTEAQFIEFMKSFIQTSFSNMKPGASYYIWHADAVGRIMRDALHDCGVELRQVLIWNKNTFILGRQDYQWKHEPCLYGWKEGAAHYFIDDRKQANVIEDLKPNFGKMKKEEMRELLEQIFSDKISTTVLEEVKPARNPLHPTMKPVKLMARLICNSSKEDEIVLDPFGGSGSTLIACEQLKRKCYTSELDPHYCDVIIKRWEDFTGRKAVMINGK